MPNWKKENLLISKGTRVKGVPARPGDILRVGEGGDCTEREAQLLMGTQLAEGTTDKAVRLKDDIKRPRSRRSQQGARASGGLTVENAGGLVANE